jgi:ribosomal protein S18 acetylase RimI-like enzyme
VPVSIRLVRDLAIAVGDARWPEGVALVPFRAALAPQAHALLQRAYATGGGSVPAEFDTWWAQTRHDSEFDANLCFVAAARAEPVGFALCWTSAFIKDIVVDPAFQRQGIGEALLLTAFNAFARRGAKAVTLKAHVDNVDALRLYRRLGFREG